VILRVVVRTPLDQTQDLNAGGVESTGNATDVAVQGNGWLRVANGNVSATDNNGQVLAFNLTNNTLGTQIGSSLDTDINPAGDIVIDPTGALIAVDNNFGTDVNGTSPGTISFYTVTSSTGALGTGQSVATGNGPLYVTFYNSH